MSDFCLERFFIHFVCFYPFPSSISQVIFTVSTNHLYSNCYRQPPTEVTPHSQHQGHVLYCPVIFIYQASRSGQKWDGLPWESTPPAACLRLEVVGCFDDSCRTVAALFTSCCFTGSWEEDQSDCIFHLNTAIYSSSLKDVSCVSILWKSGNVSSSFNFPSPSTRNYHLKCSFECGPSTNHNYWRFIRIKIFNYQRHQEFVSIFSDVKFVLQENRNFKQLWGKKVLWLTIDLLSYIC